MALDWETRGEYHFDPNGLSTIAKMMQASTEMSFPSWVCKLCGLPRRFKVVAVGVDWKRVLER